jgi:ferredoxin
MSRCIGCGLCVTRCEFDAASLVRKKGSENDVIPTNTAEQYMKIAQERGII